MEQKLRRLPLYPFNYRPKSGKHSVFSGVTPDRFELPLSGPKPLVLPLDERVILADVNGFEPLSKVLETFILPLNYTPVSGERGIRTPVSVT